MGALAKGDFGISRKCLFRNLNYSSMSDGELLAWLSTEQAIQLLDFLPNSGHIREFLKERAGR